MPSDIRQIGSKPQKAQISNGTNLLRSVHQLHRSAKILEVDDPPQADRRKLAELQSQLALNQIGRPGQLHDRLQDKDDPNDDGGHVSHLLALHPACKITPGRMASSPRA